MSRSNVTIDEENYSFVTVSIAGRFDYRLYQPLDDLFSKAYKWNNTICIDLSETEYLDSSALGLLLILREKVDPDTTIKLKNPAPNVGRTLVTANFDKLFVISDQYEGV